MLIKPKRKKFWLTGIAPYYKASGGGGDAAQTTAFLARTSGLSGTETAAYKALINGLVADGNFALLDALYILATNTTTTAALNLCGTNFSLIANGALTFTADVGYTGNGSTGYLDTQYVPSLAGLNLTQNSASLGAYIRTNRTSTDSSVIMGAATFAGQNWLYFAPLQSGGYFYDVNGVSFPGFANTSTQGAWITSRNGSSSTTSVYKNGSTIANSISSSDASTGLADQSFTLFAGDVNGGIGSFSSDQASAFFIAGGLTGAQAAQINNRINAYMAAMPTPINVY